MTSPNPSEPAVSKREQRHRNKRLRQSVIFGTIMGVMAMALLFSTAVYTGVIDGPFNIAFSEDEDAKNPAGPPPCPGPDDTPVKYGKVKIRVYNTTEVAGLASAAADDLTERGFEVIDVTNEDPAVTDAAEIRFGPHAIAEAYTVQAQIEGAVMRLDTEITDDGVDVLLGETYDSLRPTDGVDLTPDEPLTPLPDCVPVDVPDEEPDEPKADDDDDDSGDDEGDEENSEDESPEA